ncbi:HEL301Cp [Eremothecium sinecaudum]|uniref:HEL301Cp n=1 Tax=Eremothecium sinecaudum TaxID=45286 RepID=A0A0X8HT41_9SACH|nr:HEL301Cp [Eremothecium sinecaudum]AMD20980.1 HEL301Cp [Eremothecium sinecaudum]
MPRDLMDYFSQGGSNKGGVTKKQENGSSEWLGPSVSMAVEVGDRDEFERTTFNLKRTRSMGLLDEYIEPTRKLLERSSAYGGNLERTPTSFGNYSERSSVCLPPADQDAVACEQQQCNFSGSMLSPQLTVLSVGGAEDSKSPPVPDTDSFRLPLDDNDVQHEPNRHVDYLSHKWEESDISQSWKYIILKKRQKGEQDLINAARLENASWRTWAKARNNLQTVSPEMVNWSKDSDVTWLYGPIVRDNCNSTHSTHGNYNNVKSGVAQHEEFGYASDDETSKRVPAKQVEKEDRRTGPKPILKKRSVSEIIEENALWRLTVARQHRKQITDANSIMDGYGRNYQHDDYDALAARVNSQYYVSTHMASSKEPGHSTSPINSPPPQNLHTKMPVSFEIGSDANIPPQQPRPESHLNDSKSPSKIQVLPSILSKTNKEKDKLKDRHIHFNDRVEQCMAVNHHTDFDYDNDYDHDEYAYDYDDVDDDDEKYDGNVASSKGYSSHYRVAENRKYEISRDDEEVDDDEDQDDEEFGLFISATGRKMETGLNVHTDASSYGSSTGGNGGRFAIPLIIKMLPATTLNYGSDDEYCRGSDYNSGNAVSHNMNTYRGYDYVYDYNSVYTADTSNLLAFYTCDIVDVPESLRTPVTEETSINFRLDNNASEQPKELKAINALPYQHDSQVVNAFKANNQPYKNEPIQNDADGSDDSTHTNQNINSNNNSLSKNKSTDSDSLTLKRTYSLGKSNSSSLHDIQHGKAPLIQSHNFITGKQLASKSGTSLHKSSQQVPPQRPVLLKRNPSSKSFIFDDSDSDSESDSAPVKKVSHTFQPSSNDSNVRSPFSIPTKNTSASTSPKAIPPPNFGSFGSSNSHASLSDVDIPGYISPRNGSMQYMISKERIINVNSNNSNSSNNGHTSGTNTSDDTDRSRNLDLDSVSKTFENYHIDSPSAEGSDKYDRGSQGSGRMMEMASKYLNSWKR